MVTITLKAKDYKCICGKKGKYLNIKFDDKWGNALCEKCRDKALVEYNAKTKSSIPRNTKDVAYP